MKPITYLSIILFSFVLFSCENDKIQITSDVVGEWLLIEEKIVEGLIDNQPTVYEPVQSDKTITFSSNGTFQSNGEMCQMLNQDGNSSTGYFYESLQSIEPDGCQSAAPASGIRYEVKGSELIIEYPCVCGCSQKYKRI